MAKITKTDDFIEAFTTAKPPALGDKSMFGTSAIAAAIGALEAKKKASTTSIATSPKSGHATKYGYGPVGSLIYDPALGSKAGGVHTSPLSGIVPQRLSHKHRINKYEFDHLDLEAKQEIIRTITHKVAIELAEKYMGLVETPDGDIEIGIDIEVKG